jgi:hypothetical protein
MLRIHYQQEIREKNAEKRKIRKRWQMTPHPRSRTELNRITQVTKNNIRDQAAVSGRLPAGIDG